MARDSLAELRTEPFAAEREWTVEDIPVLTASVTVPRPAPAENRVSRRIHRYYQLQCRSYLRYCEHWLLPQAEAAYREALASGDAGVLAEKLAYSAARKRKMDLPGPDLLQ